MNPVKVATVLTHRRPEETGPAIDALAEIARDAGAVLRLDPEETAKHQLEPGPSVELDAPIDRDVDICFAIGGDGTILSGLRAYAGTEVPVFAVNFGEIGFLATVDRELAEVGFRRAFAGDFEVLALPGIEATGRNGPWLAINDLAMHRQPGKRVANLMYSVGPDEVGRVRCDGLVVATPAGSTGYNLANGGPVMAWGVEGFVVSFIAPHSLSARALVVAPDDVLTVSQQLARGAGRCQRRRASGVRAATGRDARGALQAAQSHLAQLAGTTFYRRLRDKFGRLATAP